MWWWSVYTVLLAMSMYVCTHTCKAEHLLMWLPKSAKWRCVCVRSYGLFYVMVIIHFVRWCCTLVTVNSNMALNVKCTHSTRWLEHCIQTNSVLCWKSFGTTHHTAVTKTKKKVYFFCRAYRREKKEHTELANRVQ